MLLAAALVVTLLAVPALQAPSPGGPAPPLAGGVHPTGASTTSVAGPSTVPPAWDRPIPLNETYLPTRGPTPALGGVPLSAVPATPPPPVPRTTPSVITFLTNARNTSVTSNFTAPAGPWATIVLNFTGRVVLGVYDSSYRAFIDRTQVMFGTSPEYGTWTVLVNLTEFTSLFESPASLTFLFGAAVTSGYFLSNLSIAFYPVPSGGPAPGEPNAVVPLWYRQSLTPSGPTVTAANVTVPTNATAAELELYLYGFAGDEFWWSTANPARVAEFGVGSTPIAAVLPFPFINTGGIDLFLWRPITAALTTNDRPYLLNVSGALGQLEGTHSVWLNLSGISAGSNWLVAGSLLVWTNASYRSATSTSASFSGPGVHQSGGSTSASVHSVVGTQFVTAASSVNVTSTFDGAFRATVPASSTWENLTESTTLSESTVTNGTGAPTVDRLYLSFPLSVDLGGQVSPSSGTYPYTANFTTEMLHTYQEWNEVRTFSVADAAGTRVTGSSSVSDQLAGASGVVNGVEVVTGPNSATLSSYSLIASSSTKQLTEQVGPAGSILPGVGGGGVWSTYAHLLVGTSYQPPSPYNAETIVSDTVGTEPFALSARAELSPPVVVLGTNVTLTADVTGGILPYQFAWSGLPFGCAPSDLRSLVCRPAAPGAYPVGLTIIDGVGSTTPTVLVELLVVAPLNVTLEANRTALDVGQAVSLRADVSGGLPPYACTLTGFSPLPMAPSPCTTVWVFVPLSPNAGVASLRVTDGLHETLTSSALTLPVAAVPVVALDSNTSAGSRVTVGTPVELSAIVYGGSAPFTYVWSVNGKAIDGSGGAVYAFVPSVPGNASLSVRVLDAAGSAVESNVLNVTAVTAAPTGVAPATTSSGDFAGYVEVALASMAAAGVLVFVLRRPPRIPRRDPVRPIARSTKRSPPPPSPEGPAGEP